MTNLTSLNVPNNVTSIGKSAFEYCDGMTSIVLSNTITSIQERTFYGCRFKECTGLTSITSEAVNPPACESYSYVFNSVDKSIPLYVPEESIDAYKIANEWKDFTNIQAIGTEDIDPISQEPKADEGRSILYPSRRQDIYHCGSKGKVIDE